MAKTAKKAYVGPRAFDGEVTRAMPEHDQHYALTLEQIKEFPVIVWNESNSQWELEEN